MKTVAMWALTLLGALLLGCSRSPEPAAAPSPQPETRAEVQLSDAELKDLVQRS